MKFREESLPILKPKIAEVGSGKKDGRQVVREVRHAIEVHCTANREVAVFIKLFLLIKGQL